MSGQAENQANVKFSYKKYYSFRNKINAKFSGRFYSDMAIDGVARALNYGDTQPALVVNTSPLLVAAYSDEMDAVLILQFPTEFAEKYNLSVGSRMTSSTVYNATGDVADDIFEGAGSSHRFSEFMPIIQLFIGKNDAKINEKVNLFPESIWEKINSMASDYMYDHPGMIRNGFWYFIKPQ